MNVTGLEQNMAQISDEEIRKRIQEHWHELSAEEKLFCELIGWN